MQEHTYKLKLQWTGNEGKGTTNYTSYERSHTISIAHKPDILASSDTPFRGDQTKHNPEDFLLASLSSCHMLWYLHLCADEGIIVVDYVDHPIGIMQQNETGGGFFTSVTLFPVVTVTEESMLERADQLHQKANEKCFIANSVNFKVEHKPRSKTLMA